MMVRWYVRVSSGVQRLVHRLAEERQGLTMIEYGVAAAFIVLLIVGVLAGVGPSLATWIRNTLNSIMTGT